jgi:hypothetical protein
VRLWVGARGGEVERWLGEDRRLGIITDAISAGGGNSELPRGDLGISGGVRS